MLGATRAAIRPSLLLALGILGSIDGAKSAQFPFPGHGLDEATVSPVNGNIRPLQWGDVQILHTTDIHGWYQGHQKSSWPEPNYSGDWGDFASFVSHMRRQAAERGVDLLLVDSGDLHDGAGLSDGFPASQGPDAHVSNEFHSMIKYDVLTVGNHELYVYANALDTFQHFIPKQHDRYLASNVNITYTTSASQTITEPMGRRFARFTTAQGRKVTSLGILLNFRDQAPGLTVQPPKQMVLESWFLEAIKNKPDFFLLVGHMPVRYDDWPVVVQAIRKVHPSVPILITGGHTHIRDCTVFDSQAVGIESGRYLETIGWLSFVLSDDSAAPLAFSRTYIDANRRNYAWHAGLATEEELSTSQGRRITREMNKVAESWNLTEVFGMNEQDYYLARVPATSPSSLLHLLTQKVLPSVISTSNAERTTIPNVVIINSGSQRFDLYKGAFTRNDQYIVSPFKDDFLYLQGVEYRYASRIADFLNLRGGASQQHEYGVKQRRHGEFAPQSSSEKDLTLGYVTVDDCPGLGDDTEHTSVPYLFQPDFLTSLPSNNKTELAQTDRIDVVFVDFALKAVVGALNKLQSQRHFTIGEAMHYNNITTQDLYRLYALQAWQDGTNT